MGDKMYMCAVGDRCNGVCAKEHRHKAFFKKDGTPADCPALYVTYGGEGRKKHRYGDREERRRTPDVRDANYDDPRNY